MESLASDSFVDAEKRQLEELKEEQKMERDGPTVAGGDFSDFDAAMAANVDGMSDQERETFFGVSRDKQKEIREMLHLAPAAAAQDADDGGDGDADDADDDAPKDEKLEKDEKLYKRGMKQVDKYLKEIEEQIEKVDADVGGKKKILDQDGDGILSTDEIAAAIREHLGGKHLKKDSKGKRRTEEEVEKMIERMLYQLDKDHDGKVAMEDLMAFVDTVKREEKEAKMLASESTKKEGRSKREKLARSGSTLMRTQSVERRDG